MGLDDASQETPAPPLALLQAVLLRVIRLLLALAALLDGAIAALLWRLAAPATETLNDEALAGGEVAEPTWALCIARAADETSTATATTAARDACVVDADEWRGAGGPGTTQLPFETTGPALRGVFEPVADQAATTLLRAALAVFTLSFTLRLRAHRPALASHPGPSRCFGGTERGPSEDRGHSSSNPAQRIYAAEPGGRETPDQIIEPFAVHGDASFHV
jgi:hypothetical protein